MGDGDSDDGDWNYAQFGKMPHTVDEFNSLRKIIGMVIFGDKPDIFLNKVNQYSRNLEAFRMVI